MRTIFYFITGLAFLFSCSSEDKKPFPEPKFKAEHGFYYWQTSWNSQVRDSLFDQLHVKHMYMRMFDVDWDPEMKKVVPVSAIDFDGDIDRVYDIESLVPVIYITNETFKHISDSASENLARQIYQKLRIIFFTAERQKIEREENDYDDQYYYEYTSESNPYYIRSKNIAVPKVYNLDSLIDSRMAKFSEIQFDCDWTPSTKKKYFKFLNACRKQFEGKTISATIRLYPYKYQKEMGVPPVDRGMLMCYNVGDVNNPDGINSIFNLAEIRKYISGEINYPLELDYALPVFSWAVLYHGKELVNVFESSVVKDENYFKVQDRQPADSNIQFYDVAEGYSSGGFIFGKGDVVKVESINYADLKELAAELGAKNKNKNPRVILYRLDENQLIENHEHVQAVFNIF